MSKSVQQRVGELEEFARQIAFTLNHTDKALPAMVNTVRQIKHSLQERSAQVEALQHELKALRSRKGVEKSPARPISSAADQGANLQKLKSVVTNQADLLNAMNTELEEKGKEIARYQGLTTELLRERELLQREIKTLYQERDTRARDVAVKCAEQQQLVAQAADDLHESNHLQIISKIIALNSGANGAPGTKLSPEIREDIKKLIFKNEEQSRIIEFQQQQLVSQQQAIDSTSMRVHDPKAPQSRGMKFDFSKDATLIASLKKQIRDSQNMVSQLQDKLARSQKEGAKQSLQLKNLFVMIFKASGSGLLLQDCCNYKSACELLEQMGGGRAGASEPPKPEQNQSAVQSSQPSPQLQNDRYSELQAQIDELKASQAAAMAAIAQQPIQQPFNATTPRQDPPFKDESTPAYQPLTSAERALPQFDMKALRLLAPPAAPTVQCQPVQSIPNEERGAERSVLAIQKSKEDNAGNPDSVLKELDLKSSMEEEPVQPQTQVEAAPKLNVNPQLISSFDNELFAQIDAETAGTNDIDQQIQIAYQQAHGQMLADRIDELMAMNDKFTAQKCDDDIDLLQDTVIATKDIQDYSFTVLTPQRKFEQETILSPQSKLLVLVFYKMNFADSNEKHPVAMYSKNIQLFQTNGIRVLIGSTDSAFSNYNFQSMLGSIEDVKVNIFEDKKAVMARDLGILRDDGSVIPSVFIIKNGTILFEAKGYHLEPNVVLQLCIRLARSEK